MEVILTESVLPPKYVRGTPGKVVGIELHALEHPVEGRASIVSDGVVVLRYMPKVVYVKNDDRDSATTAASGTRSIAPMRSFARTLRETCWRTWTSRRRRG